MRAAVHLNLLMTTMSWIECRNYTLDEAEKADKQQVGFFHFLNPDEMTIQLVAWSREPKNCFIAKDPKQHFQSPGPGYGRLRYRERKRYPQRFRQAFPIRKACRKGMCPSAGNACPIFMKIRLSRF